MYIFFLERIIILYFIIIFCIEEKCFVEQFGRVKYVPKLYFLCEEPQIYYYSTEIHSHPEMCLSIVYSSFFSRPLEF